MFLRPIAVAATVCGALLALPAHADENLLGYVRGAETIPKGGSELYLKATERDGKGSATYRATDWEVEYEYGVTDRFNVSGALQAMSIDTHGLVIDGYLPGDREFGIRSSGFEIAGKYNILRPAADGLGLSIRGALEHSWIDKHSGRDKDTTNVDVDLLAQKYFLDAQLVWVGNLGVEATYAKRRPIADLPAEFDWPTGNEMEAELRAGTGVSYRFAPNWYVGGEALYETEFETEVGQERWSVFAGPSLHYGSEKWWATLTYMPQIRGGGEKYPGQANTGLHLIEKTEHEARLKIGFNF